MYSLIRKYKIHRLTPCLNEKELEIISFIENKIKGLKLVKKDDYPKSTFYVNSDDKFILEQDDKNGWLRVRHKDFWEVLEKKHLLKQTEIEDIMRYMVLMHLKFRASTPFKCKYRSFSLVLMHLKFRASTPFYYYMFR